VKLLEEIPTFPAKVRRTLESEYGIDSAEAFFASALDNPKGMAAALRLDLGEVDRLIRVVEGHLPANFRDRCRNPVQRPRGVIIDRLPGQS
jgi:hypothetical protein